MSTPRRHRFSEGAGFDDPYEGFDLDRESTPTDPVLVDPADDHALTDILDPEQVVPADVDLDALLAVGVEYFAIEQYEQALDAFARVVRFAPEDSDVAQEAWVNAGVAHGQLEEYDEAVGAYLEAIRLGDDTEHAATAETNLAYALWAMGDSSRPLEHAERAVELDSRSAHAWYNLGFLYNERGLWEFALEALDTALSLGLRPNWVKEERQRALDGVEELRERRETDREDGTESPAERERTRGDRVAGD
ncbi:tetratricopeptide repeat protein [Halomarina litorea]|uniref:tetratricopeptide repeat protein n=1 Tax=Halomarina litorea TaxID=2961595 RepID=UPI0020C36F60|nr:tetratricopeptide repeat protein [Halomarina sp. BCD28]